MTRVIDVALAAPPRLVIPDVSGLPADAIAGPDDAPYMTRHHVDEFTRFHHLLRSDPQPDPHDHPWDFTSLVLSGGYREYTLDGAAELWAPVVIVRRAEEPHRLELLTDDVWTYVTTGPVRRRWGFHTRVGWVHWRDYPLSGHYSTPDATPRGTP